MPATRSNRAARARVEPFALSRRKRTCARADFGTGWVYVSRSARSRPSWICPRSGSGRGAVCCTSYSVTQRRCSRCPVDRVRRIRPGLWTARAAVRRGPGDPVAGTSTAARPCADRSVPTLCRTRHHTPHPPPSGHECCTVPSIARPVQQAGVATGSTIDGEDQKVADGPASDVLALHRAALHVLQPAACAARRGGGTCCTIRYRT